MDISPAPFIWSNAIYSDIIKQLASFIHYFFRNNHAVYHFT